MCKIAFINADKTRKELRALGVNLEEKDIGEREEK